MAKALTVQDLLSDDAAKDRIAELSFEAGLQLLEQLVEKVEAGTLPLDQSILSYERGVSIVGRLKEQLTGAEEKLKVLQKSGKVK